MGALLSLFRVLIAPFFQCTDDKNAPDNCFSAAGSSQSVPPRRPTGGPSSVAAVTRPIFFMQAGIQQGHAWRCAWGMNNMSSFHPCCSSVAACFHFHLLVSPRQARRTKRWTPLIITWPPKEHEVLLLDRFFLFLLCWHFAFFCFFFAQQHLLWMLPVEVWQEVLGCCSFHEYARADLVGRPASREFYSSSSRCWNCALAASSLDP